MEGRRDRGIGAARIILSAPGARIMNGVECNSCLAFASLRTKGRSVSEFVEPLGMRVLIRKDENRQKTRGGIVLPDSTEIPTITGRVVEISVQVERDEDFPIRKYDKVLFNPKHAIPVDLEPDNLLYVVPIEDVVAVFRRSAEEIQSRERDEAGESDDDAE